MRRICELVDGAGVAATSAQLGNVGEEHAVHQLSAQPIAALQQRCNCTEQFLRPAQIDNGRRLGVEQHVGVGLVEQRLFIVAYGRKGRIIFSRYCIYIIVLVYSRSNNRDQNLLFRII